MKELDWSIDEEAVKYPCTFRHPHPDITIMVPMRNAQTYTLVDDHGKLLGRVSFTKEGVATGFMPAFP